MTRLGKHGHRIVSEYRKLPASEQKEYQVFHQMNEDAARLGYSE